MDFTISSENMQKIQDWLDGKSPAPAQELEAYFRLGEAIRRRLMQQSIAAVSKSERLEERLDRYRQKDVRDAERGVFDCLGLDSVDIARAALWSAFRRGITMENKTRLRLVVYGIYCAWLGSARQRATVDHPIAQCAYGPTLPKMLDEKKVDYRQDPGDESYRKICGLEPGLAKVIDNTVGKYMSYSVKEVENYLCGKDTPFARAAEQARKNGKPMTEIPDSDIWLWKKTHSL